MKTLCVKGKGKALDSAAVERRIQAIDGIEAVRINMDTDETLLRETLAKEGLELVEAR